MNTFRIVTITALALTLAGQAFAAETRSQTPASSKEATTTQADTSKAKGHEDNKGWIELTSTQI